MHIFLGGIFFKKVFFHIQTFDHICNFLRIFLSIKKTLSASSMMIIVVQKLKFGSLHIVFCSTNHYFIAITTFFFLQHYIIQFANGLQNYRINMGTQRQYDFFRKTLQSHQTRHRIAMRMRISVAIEKQKKQTVFIRNKFDIFWAIFYL